MAHEVVKRIYSSKVKEAMSKAAEEELIDAFYIGFGFAKDGRLTASFHIIEQILMETVQKKVLDEVIDRAIDRWTQPPTFTDAIARHALTFSRFIHLVKKFIHKNLKEQSDNLDNENSPLESLFPFRRTLLLSSQSSGDLPYHIPTMTRKAEMEIIPDVAEERKK